MVVWTVFGEHSVLEVFAGFNDFTATHNSLIGRTRSLDDFNEKIKDLIEE